MGVRKANSVTRQAATATESLKLYSKLAIIYSNSLVRTVASFFIATNKFPVPIKLFDSVKKAKEWIRKQK